MWFGLRSYAAAGSLLATGNVPVVWLVGRSFVLIVRFPPALLIDAEALGHATDPWTLILVAEFHVLAVVLIHGPTAWAPPTVGNWVMHESTKPTFGVVERFPSPRGIAVGSTGRGDAAALTSSLVFAAAGPPSMPMLSASPPAMTTKRPSRRIVSLNPLIEVG